MRDTASTLIIGIDPGSRIAGFGLVAVSGFEVRHVDHGVIDVQKIEGFEKRLLQIGQELREILTAYRPHVASVEKVFLGKNPSSAFKLGHARGVCLYELAHAGVAVAEYAPRAMKRGVTGDGAASKELIQRFVFETLNITCSPRVDASDALALALHHARQFEVSRRMPGLSV